MWELSKEGTAFIIVQEGMTPQPYLDDYPGGTWTIGIGITASDGIDVKALRGSPPESIETMVGQFQHHVKRYEDEVNDVINVELTQQQFDALVSFHYNCGAINHLASHINDGESSEDILTHLKSYRLSNGHIMRGLVRRRNLEADIYLNGNYGDTTAQYIEANEEGRLLNSTIKYIDIMKYL